VVSLIRRLSVKEVIVETAGVLRWHNPATPTKNVQEVANQPKRVDVEVDPIGLCPKKCPDLALATPLSTRAQVLRRVFHRDSTTRDDLEQKFGSEVLIDIADRIDRRE